MPREKIAFKECCCLYSASAGKEVEDADTGVLPSGLKLLCEDERVAFVMGDRI